MKNVQSNIAFTFNVLSETVKVLCDSVNDRYNAIKKFLLNVIVSKIYFKESHFKS